MENLLLEKYILFRGMDKDEISACLSSLSANTKNFQKGQWIFYAGRKTNMMGLVLSGSVSVESNDVWGNRTILSHIEAGQFFAETYALLQDEVMLVDVVATEDCEILFLKVGVMQNYSTMQNNWAIKLTSNLLTISAHKNLALSGRNFHTAPRKIRDRILSYLNTLSLQKKSKEFNIPFDRQGLADYLNVERSALSFELSKMQKDGLLSYHKNHFCLL